MSDKEDDDTESYSNGIITFTSITVALGLILLIISVLVLCKYRKMLSPLWSTLSIIFIILLSPLFSIISTLIGVVQYYTIKNENQM